MKSLLCQLVLVLVLGCAQPVELDLDRGDYVSYGYGGGELGAAWSEITIRGDGEVYYRLVKPYEAEWPQKETTGAASLSGAETRMFFERVVDGGLFSIETSGPSGADVPVTQVEAVIDGREIRAQVEGTHDQHWHHVVKELFASVALRQPSEDDAAR